MPDNDAAPSPVYCVNSTCTEFNIAKENPAAIPIDEIRCGWCGQPVTATRSSA